MPEDEESEEVLLTRDADGFQASAWNGLITLKKMAMRRFARSDRPQIQPWSKQSASVTNLWGFDV
jgi:hypothetical protein